MKTNEIETGAKFDQPGQLLREPNTFLVRHIPPLSSDNYNARFANEK